MSDLFGGRPVFSRRGTSYISNTLKTLIFESILSILSNKWHFSEVTIPHSNTTHLIHLEGI